MIISLMEGYLLHPGIDTHGGRRAQITVEYVTKRGSRIYGGLGAIMGVGFVWLAFYGKRKGGRENVN